jgi:hypothetical protein
MIVMGQLMVSLDLVVLMVASEQILVQQEFGVIVLLTDRIVVFVVFVILQDKNLMTEHKILIADYVRNVKMYSIVTIKRVGMI